MAWAKARAGARDETDQARERLAGFRRELYRCFTARADALAELCDAVLCKQDRVHMLAELSLEPGHQRGHGALYDALNCGKVQASRLRWALAGVPLPAWDDGRIRLAVDVSNWLRPDAATSPGRSFCHCYGRGNNSAQMIPGWPYSLVAALEPGRTSWTRLLDAVRLGPDDDLAAVTAAQVRGVTERIIAAGHWHDGDPDIMVIFDAGYGRPGWPGCWRTCPCRCSGGWAPTGCCGRRRRPAGPARWARRCGTAASSSSAMTPAAPGRTCTPRRRPPGTGPRTPAPGTACTPS